VYRSYTVTYKFDQNVKKLQAFYTHMGVKFKSQSEMECRYIIHKYGDNVGKLWKKLEDKYGEPVLEWWEYPEKEGDEEEEKEEDLDGDAKGETDSANKDETNSDDAEL